MCVTLQNSWHVPIKKYLYISEKPDIILLVEQLNKRKWNKISGFFFFYKKGGYHICIIKYKNQCKICLLLKMYSVNFLRILCTCVIWCTWENDAPLTRFRRMSITEGWETAFFYNYIRNINFHCHNWIQHQKAWKWGQTSQVLVQWFLK